MTDRPDAASPSDMSANAGAWPSPATWTREIPIVNKRGLHARASAKFVQLVERFKADVSVTRTGATVGGASIMGLIMLSAGIGPPITVSATGAEAEAAMT